MRRYTQSIRLQASLTACLAIMIGYAGQAQAAVFPDVKGHWAERTIEWGVAESMVDGYEDGMFRPDATVSEPEFLALLERAFPEAGMPEKNGVPWYTGYYRLAETQGWALAYDTNNRFYNRGHVAQLLASTQGEKLDVNRAVQYLLDRKLAGGKTAATVAGFKSEDRLTRAEALQLIRNAKSNGLQLAPRTPATSKDQEEPQLAADYQIAGLSVGMTRSELVDKLGQPERIDASEYGFEWYVYAGDLSKYVQAGVQGERIVALYTNADNWSFASGVKPGVKQADVTQAYGEPLTSIKKGNTRYRINSEGEYGTYLLHGSYVTFFYDLQEEGRLSGVQIIDQETEENLRGFYGSSSDKLAQSYERQIFDLTNVERQKRGLTPFSWNDRLAEVARNHSDDMSANGYFAHENKQGQSPWERADAAGIKYSSFGENIAAGQTNAIYAYHGWLNSPGHRQNLLGKLQLLGVGVGFGGSMSIYYTQNFMNP